MECLARVHRDQSDEILVSQLAGPGSNRTTEPVMEGVQSALHDQFSPQHHGDSAVLFADIPDAHLARSDRLPEAHHPRTLPIY